MFVVSFLAHAGWIVKLEASDPSQYDSLLSPEDYSKFLEEETV